jgi:hypothetical protein
MLASSAMIGTFALLCLSPAIQALPPVTPTQYFTGLGAALSDAGFSHLLNALQVANTTTNGQALLSSLYSNGHFTLYASIDEVSFDESIDHVLNFFIQAWEDSGLTDPQPNDDLVALLSYHVS